MYLGGKRLRIKLQLITYTILKKYTHKKITINNTIP